MAYLAVVERNPGVPVGRRRKSGYEGAYGVTIAGVDGCYAVGDTIEEAIKNAEEALTLHLEVMAEEGMAFPEPKGIETIVKDRDVKSIEVAAIVSVRG